MGRRLLLSLCAVLAAGACNVSLSSGGDEALGSERIERFLERDLPQGGAPPIDVDRVRCVRRVPRVYPNQFACAITVEGAPVTVRVERDGDRFERLNAVLVAATLEAFMQQQYEAQLGVAVVVECSPKGQVLLSWSVGGEGRCTATDAEGASVPAPFHVDDLDGNVTVDLVNP